MSGPTIAIFVFDDAEELDWVGPWEVLAAWRNGWPDDGVSVFTMAQNDHEVTCETVNKVYEGGLTIVDRLKDGHIALVFNTTEGAAAVEDSRSIRAVALYDKIPYFTTAAAAQAAVMAMQARAEGDVGVRALQG